MASRGDSATGRPIEVTARARPIEKWRKLVIAGQPESGVFAFVCDEGTNFPEGESTAPTPLTYFVAGMAF